MPLSLANKITFMRMFCIPVFVLLLIYYDKSVLSGDKNNYLRIAASAVFLLIFLSDALDGYIARTRNQISRLGTIIDPLADKALLLSALIMLSYSSANAYQARLPVWFVWLVISRDIMLVAGGVLIHIITGTITVRARVVGKITTFLQMSIIIWIMMNLPARPFTVILWTGAFFTVASGVQYFIDGIRQFDRS